MIEKVLYLCPETREIISEENLKINNLKIDFLYSSSEIEKYNNLSEFNLIVTSQIFFNKSKHIENETKFERLLWNAIDNGTVFVVYYYYEGFDIYLRKILSALGINIIVPNFSLSKLDISEKIFEDYLVKYGSACCHFTGGFKKIICKANDTITAFEFEYKLGKIIFLPYHYSSSSNNEKLKSVDLLFSSIINYLREDLEELPSWARSAFFDEEEELLKELSKNEKAIEEFKIKLKVYENVKLLLTAKKYDLEDKVINFLRNNIGLNIARNELFKEDFWLLNDKNEKVMIGEIKSITKGMNRQKISSLDYHRESNNLDQTFPGLLIVNHHLLAESWKEKNKPIDKQDYQLSSKYHILIVRVEDLVKLWEGLNKNIFNKEEIFNYFINNVGWMRVDKDFKIDVLS